MNQSFIEQTAIDYDMPLQEVERIARLFPKQFYEKLEEHISEKRSSMLSDFESISNPSELSDLTFKSQVALMDSILWIDPTETVETYDFSTKFLDVKATLYVKLKYDRKDLPDGIYSRHIDNVQVSHKTGEPIELTDSQYEDLIKAIEGKLRLRPIVETD